MKVLIIGSGLAGMACAVRCAGHGISVTLVSPDPPERAQSVLAAGGINAAVPATDPGDSVQSHIDDTLRGGCCLNGRQAVTGLCTHAEEILRELESIGTVFSRDESGRLAVRAFGGQSHKRTYYCGSATGKQLVTALSVEVRRCEAVGLITRRTGLYFHSALIEDGVCYGALLYDGHARRLETVYADALVMAVGGQNALFGKTTGSVQCDGYAVGQLFRQGAELKNMEMIQYHPTTLETPHKRMLVSEAARGEGGRMFYEQDGRRVYFLEDKYGPRGNLMTRDVISREMAALGQQVWLDVSFLGDKLIDSRLPEVRDLCLKYRGIDIRRQPVPVEPSVHFFMGGLAVHLNHETNIRNLFAVGECASMYHGANRLGGNSLLAALYSGRVAADELSGRAPGERCPDFGTYLEEQSEALRRAAQSGSRFPVMYLRGMLSETMRKAMGIVREASTLTKGLEELEYYLSVADRLSYDSSVSAYTNYSLTGILNTARAALSCAAFRKESRGAHTRGDYPETRKEYESATVVSCENGACSVRLDRERAYES